jgi:hypothetical protein
MQEGAFLKTADLIVNNDKGIKKIKNQMSNLSR